ncbi:hypothetical protein [Arthrobacter zhaoguopingii]|uniref:hypothetical protein n=1 Tax=Arthrobacter zhaoguopingii TaxID=2681491 RepID=UPI0013584A95|nr:hypothetical protein [Arthrobacter zhaoguopingii]
MALSGNFYAGILFLLGVAALGTGLGIIAYRLIHRIANLAVKRAVSILIIVVTLAAAVILSIPTLVVILTAFGSVPFKEVSGTGESVIVVRGSWDPDHIEIWTQEGPFLYSLKKSGVLFSENTPVSSATCSLISEDKELILICGDDQEPASR